MVRYMAENQVEKAEDIKSFSGRCYRYSPAHSDEKTYVFLRKDETAVWSERLLPLMGYPRDQKQDLLCSEAEEIFFMGDAADLFVK